jgi:hypothetical protein
MGPSSRQQAVPSAEGQQQQQQHLPHQLSLPDWIDLSDAESALLEVLEGVGCSFERMRVFRNGMQRLKQLPAHAPDLRTMKADYKWLQTCLKHREEAGAVQEFAQSMDQLVDSMK